MEPELRVDDLAPGDRAVGARAWRDVCVRRVRNPADADFEAVVEAIHAVYAVHVASRALDPLRAAAAVWTARRAPFRLLPPTAWEASVHLRTSTAETGTGPSGHGGR